MDGNVEEDGDEVGLGLVDGWMLVLGEIDRDGWRVGRNDGTWLGATDCNGAGLGRSDWDGGNVVGDDWSVSPSLFKLSRTTAIATAAPRSRPILIHTTPKRHFN